MVTKLATIYPSKNILWIVYAFVIVYFPYGNDIWGLLLCTFNWILASRRLEAFPSGLDQERISLDGWFSLIGVSAFSSLPCLEVVGLPTEGYYISGKKCAPVIVKGSLLDDMVELWKTVLVTQNSLYE